MINCQGFGGGADNPHLPYNHVCNQVVYTRTHDIDIIQGWWEDQEEKSHEKMTYHGANPDNISFCCSNNNNTYARCSWTREFCHDEYSCNSENCLRDVTEKVAADFGCGCGSLGFAVALLSLELLLSIDIVREQLGPVLNTIVSTSKECPLIT